MPNTTKVHQAARNYLDVLGEAEKIAEKEREATPRVALLLLVSIPVFIVVGCLWEGIVLAKLWLWFVCPTFGLEPLRLPVAIGLSLLVSHVGPKLVLPEFRSTTVQKPTTLVAVANSLGRVTLGPAFLLLIAFVVTHWL